MSDWGAVLSGRRNPAPRRDVIAVAERMTWRPMKDHGFPQRFAARIEVETIEGTRTAEVARVLGAPDRQVTRDRVLDEFSANAGRRYEPAKVEAIASAILGIGSNSAARRLRLAPDLQAAKLQS